jgi:amino acid transporter
MVLFTAMNFGGAKFLSDSNIVVVLWKAAVPFLAIAVVAASQFNPANFHAGGGFLPFGFHGVFAALTGGVVFGLQGFEQAVHLAGEARNPQKDLSRAVITAMAVGAVMYALLQFVMIGALEPANIASGWSKPLGGDPSDYGAWYTLAVALGVTWLAKVLLIDAVISPAGAGVVYVATSARLSYALGEEREMPSALARTNEQGVPVTSILVAAVVGTLAFGPFKSWNALVAVVTGATAIMYAFAPVSLAALHRIAPERPRSYRVPMPAVVLPAAFCCANLLIYWGGFDTTWKLTVAMLAGLLTFGVGAWQMQTGAGRYMRQALWLAPWFAGHVIIGYFGRYGGGTNAIGDWVDIAVVVAFSLVVFYAAVATSLSPEMSAKEVEKDAFQINAV